MLKVNELFSGIGAFRKALINLEVEHEVVGIAEIDKYAIKSYEAMYGPVHNYGDISKSLKLDYADMWTYGFPCQDISVAGKQAGIERHTRSGLLYQVQRLLEVAYQYDELPKYLILENVKNLVGKKFRADFDEWLNYLNELGYNNYWKVLNAKNYGVPQNRERVFVVSIRKDIDTGYEFPMPFDNGIRLKDVLEDEVDEKFYISDEKVGKIINSTFTQERTRIQDGGGICQTLLSRDYKDPKCVPCITPDREEKRQNGRRFKEDGDPMFTLTSQDRHGVLQVGNIVDTGNWGNPQRGRIYSSDGCSPALNTCGGGGLEPKVMVKEATMELPINKFPKMVNPIVIVDKYLESNEISEPIALDEQNKCIRKDFCVGTITTDGSSPKKNNRVVIPACSQATIQRVDIPQTVSVRKHKADTAKLVNLLRSHKQHLSNKEIAEKLNKPVTLVEHWFRTDNCFAIPDADVWMELKDLLNINTDEFDQCVMEFEERDGVFEKANRCYHEDGISPTLTSTSADEKVITSCNQAVVQKGEKDGQNGKRNSVETLRALRNQIGEEAFSEWGLGIVECFQQEKVLRQRVYEQKLPEFRNWESDNQQRTYNCKESEQVDNKKRSLLEMWEKWKGRCASQGWKLSEQLVRQLDNFMQELSYEDAQGQGCLQDLWKACEGIELLRQTLSEIQEVWQPINELPQSSYRIRKLVPLECFRLMGFSDSDFQKCVDAGISNSQLYKQAGNSIVVDVLFYMLKNLLKEKQHEK